MPNHVLFNLSSTVQLLPNVILFEIIYCACTFTEEKRNILCQVSLNNQLMSLRCPIGYASNDVWTGVFYYYFP